MPQRRRASTTLHNRLPFTSTTTGVEANPQVLVSSGSARLRELDVLGFAGSGGAAWGCLVGPVQVRVCDDLLRCGRTPLRVVLGRVCVAYQNRVIATSQRSVQRAPDALIGLRANDDQPPDAQI